MTTHPTPDPAERVDYRLTFAATATSRRLSRDCLHGPDLPNISWHLRPEAPTAGTSRAPERPTSSGDWYLTGGPAPRSADIQIDAWFAAAIAEAVHEALEWFWVDGARHLNPHGPDEDTIEALCTEFTDRLIALRRGTD